MQTLLFGHLSRRPPADISRWRSWESRFSPRLRMAAPGFLALGLILFAGPAQAVVADTLEALSEKSLGSPDAPVEVVEYASLTCHHCAEFHQNVLPQLESTYIDTGKVRFIYRDFPLDRYALNATMLARCSGDKGFFPFIDVLYKQHEKWTRADDPFKALGRLARLSGMSSEDFKVCLGNDAIQDGILKNRLEAERRYKINATPTLLINGEKYDGKKTFEAIARAIDKALP